MQIYPVDPRFYQIVFLSSFLLLGVVFRDFQVGWAQIGIVITAGLSTQVLAILKYKLPWTSLRSALISSLGLLLLIRSQSNALLIGAIVVAISSKFLLRYQGKHFFNPTNFALALILIFSKNAWVSPAQWGEEVLIAAWIILLGIVVTQRSLRTDISFSFLVCYLLFFSIRVSYLGQPYTVFFHQLKNGSLLLFTFFMISDPKSTPDHPSGRVLFSFLVAALAYFIKFHLYNPNALILALFFLSPLTLLIDKLFPAKRFDWPKAHTHQRSSNYYETFDLAVSNPARF